jgi:hypothetical protein
MYLKEVIMLKIKCKLCRLTGGCHIMEQFPIKWIFCCSLLRRKALTLAVQKSGSNKSEAGNGCNPVEKTLHCSPVDFCVKVNST